MISINPADLTAKATYKLISGSLIPRPIAWITTFNAKQTVINLAPFSFFSGVAGKLPLVSVAILRNDDGSMKHTAKNLVITKEGVIHIVSEGLAHQMNLSAASVDEGETELKITELETTKSQVVAVPALKSPKVRFEVKLHQYVPIKDDQDMVISDLFILKVVEMHFDDAVIDLEHHYIQAKALKPVARLAGPEYANLGKTYKISRPK